MNSPVVKTVRSRFKAHDGTILDIVHSLSPEEFIRLSQEWINRDDVGTISPISEASLCAYILIHYPGAICYPKETFDDMVTVGFFENSTQEEFNSENN